MNSMKSQLIPLLLVPLALEAQVDIQAAARRDAAASVAAISRQLRWGDSAGEAQYRENRDSLTAQIHSSIDKYIAERADPSLTNSAAIETDLSEILATHRGDPEYNGPPYVRLANLLGGTSFVVGYKLRRGGSAFDDSSVTFRGYRAEQGRFKLADTVGADLDGYGLFTHELVSPAPGEVWLLAWGGLSGFNGNKTRLRIFAFDGNKFRTVWSPADALNVTVGFNSNGFSVNRLDEEPYYKTKKCPCHLREDYVLMQDGVRQVSSHYTD
jgi:hypothetical protein